MKTPLSPTQLVENGLCFALPGFVEINEYDEVTADMMLQQETKKAHYSLCQVCNIQLHSAAQAQVHFNGKSHLRRVKQLNHGEIPSAAPAPSHSQGSSCHNNVLPALTRSSSLMMQSSVDMKPFMTFPVESSTPVGLFPNFNTMDPVQKAVINHTFGVSIPPKKKQVISCNICQIRFNSDSQAEAHYKGGKHAKKLKAQDSTKTKAKNTASADSKALATDATSTSSSDQPEKNGEAFPEQDSDCVPAPVVPSVASLPSPCKKAAPHASPPTEPSGQTPVKPAAVPTAPSEPSLESEEEKAKKLLYCSLCKVAVNSLSQLEAHNTGSKHKTMLEARNGAGPIKAYPRTGSKLKVQTTAPNKGSGLQNKTFHCEICDVHVNSEIQLKQHISSRRHKDRVAGKPTKPKYSPYNKHQRSSSSQAAKQAMKKEVKPISPTFLPTPFSPPSVPSISFHQRPSASLFQTASLPHSFLRSAPGPVRHTAGSILFAPY